jgi:hypothetical protein
MASLSSRVIWPSTARTRVAIGAREPTQGHPVLVAACAPPAVVAAIIVSAEHARSAAVAAVAPRRMAPRRARDVSGVTSPPALVASVTLVTLLNALSARRSFYVNLCVNEHSYGNLIIQGRPNDGSWKRVFGCSRVSVRTNPCPSQAATSCELPDEHTSAAALIAARTLTDKALATAGLNRDALIGAGVSLPGPVCRHPDVVKSSAILPGWRGVTHGRGRGPDPGPDPGRHPPAHRAQRGPGSRPGPAGYLAHGAGRHCLGPRRVGLAAVATPQDRPA